MNKKAIAAIAGTALAGGAYFLTPSPEPTGHLYVMRGLFGGRGFQFSYGVDEAAKKAAEKYGIRYSVSSWRSSAAMCKLAAEQYRKDKKPVFLLGHSLGGDRVTSVAWCLDAEKIPVRFAFYFDPTPNVGCVPSNVQFATSWRRSFPLDLGGGYVKRCGGSKKDIANVTLANSRHTSLDDDARAHNGLLARIGLVLKGG